MRKERKIINTNIRLNLMEPDDLEAWEHLQHMDRKKYKSYSRAVVASVNDHFRREDAISDDPYLETRQKEDQFLKKVLETIEKGAQRSMPMVMMNSLIALLQPAAREFPSYPIESHHPADMTASSTDLEKDTASDESLDDALDFADSF